IKVDQQFIFGDCATIPELAVSYLAEIADESAKTAQSFGMDPRVAMLSFSTKGSAKSDDTEKASEAVNMAPEKIDAENLSDVIIDGEFQFDAAFLPDRLL
ncbi:phosphate acetyltransferase, partial [Staphylococcus pseudintermedius]|uniref:phosphate acyltransferase n=1 Tax=Staphylococcus pseudintermedius TaxID=283734 RepID=UPI000E3626B7